MASEIISPSMPGDRAVAKPYNGMARLLVKVPHELLPVLEPAVGGVPGVSGELGTARIVSTHDGMEIKVPLGWVSYVADCLDNILGGIYPPDWDQ